MADLKSKIELEMVSGSDWGDVLYKLEGGLYEIVAGVLGSDFQSSEIASPKRIKITTEVTVEDV